MFLNFGNNLLHDQSICNVRFHYVNQWLFQLNFRKQTRIVYEFTRISEKKKNRYHNFADGIFLNFTTNISLIDLLADVLGLLLSDET